MIKQSNDGVDPAAPGGGRPKTLFTWLAIFILLLIAGWLRLVNLGYSEFQGDEIKALVNLSGGESLVDFLLRQRKPPLQWLITSAYGYFDPDVSSHFLARLPFALAAIASVLVFYCLVALHFGRFVAMASASLMAANGLFVALGRIVQYQSFTMLLMLLSLLFLSLAIKRDRWRYTGLYLGAIAGAVAMLSHFDAASVLLPALLLLAQWRRKYAAAGAATIAHLWIAPAIFAVIVSSFYLPYALSLNSYQLGYWSHRMFGSTSNSVTVFTYYNSIIVLIFFALFVPFSPSRLGRSFSTLFLLSWLVPALVFMEFFMASPNTHIYAYLLPLFVLVALGLEALCSTLSGSPWRIFSRGAVGIFVVGLLSSIVVSHSLFVDHQPEFPSNKKYVLGLKKTRQHVSTMGFPHRRHWPLVAEALKSTRDRESARFLTNEKGGIASHYLRGVMEMLSPNASAVPERIYLILVEGSQSTSAQLVGKPLDHWRTRGLEQVEIPLPPGAVGSVEIMILEDRDQLKAVLASL